MVQRILTHEVRPLLNSDGLSMPHGYRIWGDASGLTGTLDPDLVGDVTYLDGDLTGIHGVLTGSVMGNVTNITGDVSGVVGLVDATLLGDVTNITGDLIGLCGTIHPLLRGDVSGLQGDLSNLMGRATNARGTIPNGYLTEPTEIADLTVSS